MDRRSFLGSAAGAIVTGAVGAAAAQSTAAIPLQFVQQRAGTGAYRRTRTEKQPHLILISADMMSPDLYHPARPYRSTYASPTCAHSCRTARFFANAFCTVPLCAPSRASYMTGRYSYIQGNGERAPDGLETQLRPNDIIFPEYLRAAGYVCRQAGKGHIGTKKYLDAFGENDQPWDRWSPPIFDDDEYLTYQRELGVKPQKYAREIVFKQQDRITPSNSAGGWIVQKNGKPFPLEAHYSYFLTKRATDFVRDAVRTGAAANIHFTYSSTSSTRTSRSPFPRALSNVSVSCAR